MGDIEEALGYWGREGGGGELKYRVDFQPKESAENECFLSSGSVDSSITTASSCSGGGGTWRTATTNRWIGFPKNSTTDDMGKRTSGTDIIGQVQELSYTVTHLTSTTDYAFQIVLGRHLEVDKPSWPFLGEIRTL